MALHAAGNADVDVVEATAGAARDVDSFIGDLAAYRDRFGQPDDAGQIGTAITELRQYREALMTVGAEICPTTSPRP